MGGSKNRTESKSRRGRGGPRCPSTAGASLRSRLRPDASRPAISRRACFSGSEENLGAFYVLLPRARTSRSIAWKQNHPLVDFRSKKPALLTSDGQTVPGVEAVIGHCISEGQEKTPRAERLRETVRMRHSAHPVSLKNNSPTFK